ncbi:DUF4176 domain-containing protein [Latilactobacillus graminis]|uniref:DUF4176 domain-containing protein n=2 Tax=Latilactobacillus graminis TaxID=60519 RepID=A0AA89I0Q2_9LACO|nr:DUF4176 domain-containing protein [Latilactobacillus graminis]KRM22320.1 hypothetical protein FC90_GL000921 [Latilactobacillus graminis DSM 20719]QFP79506.1 DUF4176 domain-containing protein [Latilactobacillus graminis]
MNNNILPLGTIVLLKNADQALMIISRVPLTKGNKGENVYFDYGAVLVPQGLQSSDEIIMFNHEQIETIGFMGFIDINEQQYVDEMPKIIGESGYVRAENTK